MKISQRRPSQNSEDDKYCARFVYRSLRFAVRRGLIVPQWFERLPENLQSPIYYGYACRLIGVKRGR